MADLITYQEVSSVIAAILTLHPQFEPTFHKFERLAWTTCAKGIMKKADNGGLMIAERNSITGRIEILFCASAGIED